MVMSPDVPPTLKVSGFCHFDDSSCSDIIYIVAVSIASDIKLHDYHYTIVLQVGSVMDLVYWLCQCSLGTRLVCKDDPSLLGVNCFPSL